MMIMIWISALLVKLIQLRECLLTATPLFKQSNQQTALCPAINEHTLYINLDNISHDNSPRFYSKDDSKIVSRSRKRKKDPNTWKINIA